PWQSPPVDESAAAELKGAAGAGAHLLSEGQVDQLHSQMQSQAFDQGYREGLASGQSEVAARAQRFEALMNRLAYPFEELDAAVEDELIDLAKILATHILRRELKSDPGQIIGAVRDCFEVLPAAARNVRLFLHPEDAQLVREYASADLARGWTIQEDASVAQGSLRIESDASHIDGRIESRLNEIVGTALGTSRSRDTES
ncbi:MAG: hypothetical protein HKN84_14305, partial [Gammaproteobacteria bacterium]|nr:hypothetical protein [Gammaproteobacteria bacterium]